MKSIRLPLCLLALWFAATLPSFAAPPAQPVPDALKPWEIWATWDDEHRFCPTPYSDAQKHLCFWPSRLGIQATKDGGMFDFVVIAYHETWVPLPGGRDAWPVEVKVGGIPVAVLEHDGQPSVQLGAGTVRIEGAWRWSEVPQRLAVPPSIGLLALVIDGQPVEAPVWDAQGFVWLKRDGSTEEADKNFLAVKLYAALEDGIPLWLRTEIELTVSGKSREEELGTILPEGWKLAAVESQIPVAVDDAGRMKAQVRAGKWTIRADAFRFDNPKEFRYAEGAKPAVPEQLVAFRARPDFRTVEITGAPSIDVSQTPFPEKWRELPVYRWETGTPFRLEERMRGMGDQKPPGLKIAREWWLDEDGRALTFRDQLSGAGQRIWRLDAAEGQDLGSVRSAGQGQLITRNPQTAAPGVEIRTRNLQLEATGRMPRAGALPATGWRADADALRVNLNLPPGWRLLALFGADWTSGDWLTAWTLLDLFLLLIFALAVGRLWGVGVGVLAFVAFGLAYHEPGAPRYLWLILLVPLALQRVVPEGWGRRLVTWGKWFVLACFVLAFVPFVARQVQQAIYPQLEVVRSNRVMGFADLPDFTAGDDVMQAQTNAPAAAPPQREQAEAYSSTNVFSSAGRKSGVAKSDNLLYDAKARIQTGPGVPEWKWREVSFGWNGPVTAGQQVRPVLISLGVERTLSALRVALLLALAAVLLGARKIGGAGFRATGKAAATLVLAFTALSASAQTPLLRGLEGEAGLRKMRVESEDSRETTLAHDDERNAVGERPVFVGMLPKQLPRGFEDRRAHVETFNPATVQHRPADLDRDGVASKSIVQKGYDFIENKSRRHQFVRRRQKRAPVRLRHRVALVAGQRQRDEKTGIQKGRAHSVDVIIQAARSVRDRIVDGVLAETEDRIIHGMVSKAQQVRLRGATRRRFRRRGDRNARSVWKMNAGRELDRVVVNDGGEAHAHSLRSAWKTGKSGLAALLVFAFTLANASAQTAIPNDSTLQKLRTRLLEPSDAYPHAADIPLATLTLTDGKLTLDAEIHAAIRTAVPLPGKLPAWSPIAIFIDDKPDVALRRDDGFLWVVVEPGVHRVRVEGSLASVTEWEWSYLLKPRLVKIDAPEWTFTGVKPGGVPEAQVFFARKQKAAAGQASYDRQDFSSIVVIERHLELGLIWQVRTTVTRLSPAGKAVALRVPLLPGENVLSSNAVVKDGFIEVRLAAQEQSASWESGLPITPTLALTTRADDTWVERWRLVASPVWNVTLGGLMPTFQTEEPQPSTSNRLIVAAGGDLIPTWQPWPGESVSLAISRPEALAGATVTVSRGTHDIALGKRQRTAKLDLALRCSLGEDFLLALPADAEVTALTHDGRAIPVRQDAGKLIIPVRPGEQTVSVAWKTNVALGFRAQAGEVGLPVESANITTIIQVPEDRWVLWAAGPRLGPAVRFWGVLMCALISAIGLGRLALSPLGIGAWMLLVIGLTQVPLTAALVVVGWLFLLAWRGKESCQRLGNVPYNVLQIFLIGLTAISLGILVTAVSEGLLGTPVMFITGNDSTSETLRWFQARSDTQLPRPFVLTISIWWYRLAMLAWALWLAAALLRWLRLGWQNFSAGGFFHRKPKAAATPPPLSSAPKAPL